MTSSWAASVFAGLALALAPPPVWAQVTDTPLHETESTKRIELGGGLGAAWWGPYGAYGRGEGTWFPSLEARVNISPKFALDVVTDFYTTSRDGIGGQYLLQVHQTVGTPEGRIRPFVNYGVSGQFEYWQYHERQTTYPSGNTIVFPGYRHAELSTPFTLVGGGGYRVRLARHLFLEAGAQAWVPIGYWMPRALFHVGVTVPVGR